MGSSKWRAEPTVPNMAALSAKSTCLPAEDRTNSTAALFEFLRNSNLDAKNFFDPAGPVAAFKRNQFVGTIGGALRIPKVFNGKDKVFFFFDYEGLRQRKAQNRYFQHAAGAGPHREFCRLERSDL